MMKKFFLVAGVLVLAFGVLVLSLDKAIMTTKAASTLNFTVKEATLSSEARKEKVSYYLPYPGILPDHPLYKIKMVRDRVWLFLTRSGYERVGLLLLFANKRVEAGRILVEGNKVDLGVTTMTKGIKYMERAITEWKELSEEERIKMKEEFEKALLKYEEIIVDLKEKITGDGRSVLEESLIFVKNLLETVRLF